METYDLSGAKLKLPPRTLGVRSLLYSDFHVAGSLNVPHTADFWMHRWKGTSR